LVFRVVIVIAIAIVNRYRLFRPTMCVAKQETMAE